MKHNAEDEGPSQGAGRIWPSFDPELTSTPFSLDERGHPTQRQLAIAALIQHIWDRTTNAAFKDKHTFAHPNAGIPQSRLPPTDRWANTFSAMVLDRWINEFAARFGGLVSLFPGSYGERRAAHLLYMLWSIARFGADGERTDIRRQPSSIRDVPSSDLRQMREYWVLSLRSTIQGEFDERFENSFRPTLSQTVVDRCIVRAAIACQYLQDSDLSLIASERDLDDWANQLGSLSEARARLRRGSGSRSRSVILISGPTATGKSAVAWELARMLDGVAIALDPFQICAVPPLSLGVGLSSHLPPNHVRTGLYRMKKPTAKRPTPNTVADWVAEAVNDANHRDLSVVIEGGSSLTATILWERGVPSNTIVFDADPRNADVRVRKRMLAERMNPANLLTEALAVRASGLESTWVVQESLIYPKVFQCLDRQATEDEMMACIQRDWQRLAVDQQQWFTDLRSREGVTGLSPTRQSAESIAQLVDL